MIAVCDSSDSTAGVVHADFRPVRFPVQRTAASSTAFYAVGRHQLHDFHRRLHRRGQPRGGQQRGPETRHPRAAGLKPRWLKPERPAQSRRASPPSRCESGARPSAGLLFSVFRVRPTLRRRSPHKPNQLPYRPELRGIPRRYHRRRGAGQGLGFAERADPVCVCPFSPSAEPRPKPQSSPCDAITARSRTAHRSQRAQQAASARPRPSRHPDSDAAL